MPDIKLTQFSHGGGCGCKIAPAVLSDILAKLQQSLPYPELLVGTESSDDAAVYRINPQQAIVATTDFFTPIVDDPYDFGRIAATNALSDIYAMGGKPLFALAIVGMPIDKLPVETIRAILAGGEAVCEQAHIPVAGGHSIDTPEPIYGLVVIGLVHPDRVKRNNQARAEDAVILGKAIGVGVLSAALKKGQLSEQGYVEMITSATQLNHVGAQLADMDEIHALTDVTGFGVLGHLLETCRGSKLGATINFDRLSILPSARELAQQGFHTGAAERNWASYGHAVNLSPNLTDWQRKLLCDPQTSGGLLVCCAPESVQQVLRVFAREGFGFARQIGVMSDGPERVAVT
ncbi:MAG: selenide, water dikinase SelD [Burkholderiales bacterium]